MAKTQKKCGGYTLLMPNGRSLSIKQKEGRDMAALIHEVPAETKLIAVLDADDLLEFGMQAIRIGLELRGM